MFNDDLFFKINFNIYNPSKFYKLSFYWEKLLFYFTVWQSVEERETKRPGTSPHPDKTITITATRLVVTLATIYSYTLICPVDVHTSTYESRADWPLIWLHVSVMSSVDKPRRITLRFAHAWQRYGPHVTIQEIKHSFVICLISREREIGAISTAGCQLQKIRVKSVVFVQSVFWQLKWKLERIQMALTYIIIINKNKIGLPWL